MPIPLNKLSYTALNLHTANKSPKSLCGIGILVVDNGIVTKQEFIFVKPKTKSFSFSQYGYFTEKNIASAPSLKDLWPTLSPYIEGKNVVVYDIEKSLNILSQSLKVFGIDMPKFACVDVRDMFPANNANGFSYFGLAATCGYSNNFQKGNAMENLNLYKACIEYGANRGNRILQRNFKVKSVKSVKSPQSKPSIQAVEFENSVVSTVQKRGGCGCAVFPIIIVFVFALLSLFL